MLFNLTRLLMSKVQLVLSILKIINFVKITQRNYNPYILSTNLALRNSPNDDAKFTNNTFR